MPKRKQALEPRSDSRSRRAASKVALMQMQKLSNKSIYEEPETLEILSDDDEPVAVEVPPKKKYKLTHKKSSDGHDRDVIVLKTVSALNTYTVDTETLTLDCWPEELSPAQLENEKKIKKEWDELNKELESYMKNKASQLVYNGESLTVYDVSGSGNLQESTPFQQQPVPVMQSLKANNSSSSVKLVMDVNSGMVLGTMTPTNLISAVPQSLQASTPTTRSNSPMTRAKKAATPSTSKLVKVTPPEASKQKEIHPISISSSNSTSSTTREGPVVDLTRDELNKSTADSREVTFNKLQGKTFPSLVVVARPLLNVLNFNTNRTGLDTRVKTVLMYQPTKFTEWLIQQGLIRSEQTCTTHPENKLKLGIYSDTTKFTISGGYVWVADCCPSKFVSVFRGSIFEGTPHSSVVMLKLIYHWACQTLVQNVIQWVKVDNLYLKGMFTWLRSVCTVALHTHTPILGGPGVKVEVGVISLGTTSHDGNQRQVKVEVLGVLETATRRIRLRAVEPLDDADRNYKKRFMKILEPLLNWVHPDSFIITDLTVDKHTLHSMGFQYVHQGSANDTTNSNNVIMEYLRKVVPRMFQNTLSLLSRHIIQQFLDELVWREWNGTTAPAAFDNIIAHIAEQTKIDFGMSLIVRLNKVAVNPFKNWSIKAGKTIFKVPPTCASTSTAVTPPVNAIALNVPKRQYGKKKVEETTFLDKTKLSSEKLVPLENFYYGSLAGDHYVADFYPHEIKCTLCNKKACKNNIEMMDHLFTHAVNTTGIVGKQFQCRYCLTIFKQEDSLNTHIQLAHPVETKLASTYACLICTYKSKSNVALAKHMTANHVRSELPYKCEVCGFRTSAHRDIINHFYKVHIGGSQLQCPFCLKTVSMMKQKRVPYMSIFVHHLAKHLKKGAYKKCPKCTMTFINKTEYNEHAIKMHASLRGRHGLVKRIPKNGSTCLIPLGKLTKEENEDDVIDLKSLVINIDNRLKCIECRDKLSSSLHFPSVQSCSNNCQYTTCCKKAMKNHKCKQLNAALPFSRLPYKMYCICGYSETDGNAVAKHLAVCERKSAYPSLESAQAATVTHSMLDVLGLVRKPETEEPAATSSNEPSTVNENDSNTTKTSEKEAVGKIINDDNDIEIIESDDNVSVDNATIQNVMDIIDKDTENNDKEEDAVIATSEKEKDEKDKNESDKSKELNDITEDTQTDDVEKTIEPSVECSDVQEATEKENTQLDDNNAKSTDNTEEVDEREQSDNEAQLDNTQAESNQQVEEEGDSNHVSEDNDQNQVTSENENALLEELDENSLPEEDKEAEKNVENTNDEQSDIEEIINSSSPAIDDSIANDVTMGALSPMLEEPISNNLTNESTTNIQNESEFMDVDNDVHGMDVDENAVEESTDKVLADETNKWNDSEGSQMLDLNDESAENFVAKNKDFMENEDISKEFAIDDGGLVGNDKLLEF